MDAVEVNQLEDQELGGQMSFLDHLDELRRRLVRAALIITIAFVGCWYFHEEIYNFLAIPVVKAIAEAQRKAQHFHAATARHPIVSVFMEHHQQRDCADKRKQGNHAKAPCAREARALPLAAHGSAVSQPCALRHRHRARLQDYRPH